MIISSSKFQIHPLKALRDNYIWVMHDGENAWAVDPGESHPLILFLEKNNLFLEGIFLTHHHYDHSGGIAYLIKKFPHANIVASHQSSVSGITKPVKEGDEITCFGMQFQAMEISGHTLDHIAYYSKNYVFTGDTLFSAGCGRVFEGTYDMMYQSLLKLRNLPDKTAIFCGHEYTKNNLKFAMLVEPKNIFIHEKLKWIDETLARNKPTLPSSIQDEKNINPFFRCEESTVIAAVEEKIGKKLSNPIEVFKYLREWKNNFV